MKKNYENNQLLFSLIFVFLIIEVLIITCFLKISYRTYNTLSMIIITDNYIKGYVNNNELRKLNNSKYLYLDNKKYKFKLISTNRKVLKKDNKWYHEVIINLNLSNKYKDNDMIVVSIYSKKEKLYNIFKVCWEEQLLRKISENDLEKINGGFSAWAALGIASTVIFLAGVLDGIVHPKACTE